MLIKLDNVNYNYPVFGGIPGPALVDVNLSVTEGSFVAIIGSSGAGKSTLLSLLNGIDMPTSGTVYVEGRDISKLKGQELKLLRKKVGVVWQFPEHQLFANTVAEDIAFGLHNYGFEDTHIPERIRQSLELVNLDEDIGKRSPFALSGGQQRLVAIAGILAIEPHVLVMDEPTVGLDPQTRKTLINLIKRLQADRGMTIIIATHDLQLVAECAGQVLLLNNGQVVKQGAPTDVLSEQEMLRDAGLEPPFIIQIFNDLAKVGLLEEERVVSMEVGAEVIAGLVRRSRDD